MIVRNHLAPLLAGHGIVFVPIPGEVNYEEVLRRDWQELAGVDLLKQSPETVLLLTKLSNQRGLQASPTVEEQGRELGRAKRRISELEAENRRIPSCRGFRTSSR